MEWIYRNNILYQRCWFENGTITAKYISFWNRAFISIIGQRELQTAHSTLQICLLLVQVKSWEKSVDSSVPLFIFSSIIHSLHLNNYLYTGKYNFNFIQSAQAQFSNHFFCQLGFFFFQCIGRIFCIRLAKHIF